MQRVLITGSNRGLGLGLVQSFAQAGTAEIYATCREPDSAQDLQALAARYSPQIRVMALDVADPAAIEACAAELMQRSEALDVLINNAAVNPPRSSQRLESITRGAMRDTFEVNALAPLFLSRAMLPLLQRGQQPRLLNISTQQGSMQWKTQGGVYAYAASKAALNMITRCLAADLSGQVTVIAVHPGWVQTDMGGGSAPLSIAESAESLYRLLAGLSPADSGRFFKWDGTTHPW